MRFLLSPLFLSIFFIASLFSGESFATTSHRKTFHKKDFVSPKKTKYPQALSPSAQGRQAVTTQSLGDNLFKTNPASVSQNSTVLLAIVPGPLGITLQRSIKSLIEQPLKQQYKIIPPLFFNQALLRYHLKPEQAAKIPILRNIGKELGSRHVVLLMTQKSRTSSFLQVIVMRSDNGKELLSDRFKLNKGRLLNATLAKIIVERIGNTINKDLNISNPSERPDASEDPTEPHLASTQDNANHANQPNATLTNKDDDFFVKPTNPSTDKITDTSQWLLRKTFIADIGISFIQRNALSFAQTISGPCYCGTENSPNPYFPAAQLGLDVYPFHWPEKQPENFLLRDLHLHTESFATSTTTSYSNPGVEQSQTTSNAMWQLRIAPGLRAVLPITSSFKPDIIIRLGYEIFSFPLRVGLFPGLTYQGLYTQLAVNLPLFQDRLYAYGSFESAPLLTTSIQGTNALANTSPPYSSAAFNLGSKNSGYSLGGSGGLHVKILPWLGVRAFVHYTVYNISYTGLSNVSSINDPSVKLNNMRIKDDLISFGSTLTFAY